MKGRFKTRAAAEVQRRKSQAKHCNKARLSEYLGVLAAQKCEPSYRCVEHPTDEINESQADGTNSRSPHSLRVTPVKQAVNLKATCVELGPITTSHNKRLMTVSMKLGTLGESMTITVSVPNDGEQDDICALGFARARYIARHFCELPFEFRSDKGTGSVAPTLSCATSPRHEMIQTRWSNSGYARRAAEPPSS